MAYHIKRPRPFESGDVYYKSDGDQWTGTYADRKQFSTEAQANAQMNNSIKILPIEFSKIDIIFLTKI